MVSGMRLVLAMAVLLRIAIVPEEAYIVIEGAWVLSTGYLLYSLAAFLCAYAGIPWARGSFVHWLDLAWTTGIVAMTGGASSIFFLFYFFAMLSASFRYGLQEGVRVAVAAVVLFAVGGLIAGAEMEAEQLPQLLLRMAFLLALGYMSAQWGESKVAFARRLGLLRDVSRMSNPRFGAERTITEVMQTIRRFFHGEACVLVLRSRDTGGVTMRTVHADAAASPIVCKHLDGELGGTLLSLPRAAELCYSRTRKPPFGQSRSARRVEAEQLMALADLLGADSFLSAPFSLHDAEGRIYVLGGNASGRDDAAFLGQAITHAYSMIRNIELLDGMATEAASAERRRLGWNLHDAAIQPYLGLQLGLSALRKKTPASNPLREDVDRLFHMTESVIAELRQAAGSLAREAAQAESVLETMLRKRVQHLKQYHGVELQLRLDALPGLNDRLAAEVLCLVSEGVSNIRRHTAARRGTVRLEGQRDQLLVLIENETGGESAPPFVPRTISERARALGGRVTVQRDPHGTRVRISIPV